MFSSLSLEPNSAKSSFINLVDTEALSRNLTSRPPTGRRGKNQCKQAFESQPEDPKTARPVSAAFDTSHLIQSRPDKLGSGRGKKHSGKGVTGQSVAYNLLNPPAPVASMVDHDNPTFSSTVDFNGLPGSPIKQRKMAARANLSGTTLEMSGMQVPSSLESSLQSKKLDIKGVTGGISTQNFAAMCFGGEGDKPTLTHRERTDVHYKDASSFKSNFMSIGRETAPPQTADPLTTISHAPFANDHNFKEITASDAVNKKTTSLGSYNNSTAFNPITGKTNANAAAALNNVVSNSDAAGMGSNMYDKFVKKIWGLDERPTPRDATITTPYATTGNVELVTSARLANSLAEKKLNKPTKSSKAESGASSFESAFEKAASTNTKAKPLFKSVANWTNDMPVTDA